MRSDECCAADTRDTPEDDDVCLVEREKTKRMRMRYKAMVASHYSSGGISKRREVQWKC